MSISFVLRLVPSALAAGDIVGQVEHVETGRTGTFRSLEELYAHLTVHLPIETVPGEIL